MNLTHRSSKVKNQVLPYGDPLPAAAVRGNAALVAACRVGGDRDSAPPMLIGGSLHVGKMVLRSAAIDWLSLTMALPTASQVMFDPDLASFDYAGGRSAGFKNSERWRVLGGGAWRKYNPHQSSRDFLLDYECWEFDGESADCIDGYGRLINARSTRVDPCWDFDCPADMTAEQFAETLLPTTKAGLTYSRAGSPESSTCYIGGFESDQQIRIYRKDLEDPIYGSMWGSTMRLELKQRGDRADVLWRLLNRSERKQAFLVAAAIVADMVGVLPQASDADVPSRAKPKAAVAASRVDQFLRQYAGFVDACLRAGLPLGALAAARAAGASRMSKHRCDKFVEEVKSVGVGEVVKLCDLVDPVAAENRKFVEEVNRWRTESV